jgi:hypothetical protein
MSADTDNMLAKLQLALSQQSNQGPSLFGLTAQTDPNTTAALLKHLQDRAYVQQQGNPGGDWADQFGQAGKKDFARMGQGISSLLGIGQPQQYDNSATMNQRQAIQQGQGQLATSLAQPGADPLQSRVDVLTKLAQAGVPGAAQALATATDDLTKMQTSKASAGKDNAQASEATARIANMADEQAHRSFEQGGQTWNFVSEKDGVQLYKNANGEPKVVTTQPSKTIPTAPIDPAAMANAVDMVGTNKIGIADALSRMAGPQRFEFLSQLGAKYPDYNTPGFKAKTAIVQAYTSGSQGQAVIKMENAANHSDMVDQAGQALENGDLPKLNKIANALGVQTGGLTTPVAVYNAILPIYAAEVNSSLVKGGGGEAEREARIAALGSDLPQPSRHAALMGIQGMLRAQAGNMEHTYRKASGNNDFYDLYPGLKQGTADPQAPPVAPPQASPQAASRPPVQVKSRADAMALPAGTVFVTPDGRQLVR